MRTKIIYEDKDIIVCHKPAGFPVQTRKTGSMDMESELKNYLYLKNIEKRVPFIGIIHRLDQPVEGLLVFAKNSKAAAKLNRQMQTSNFGKYYLAEIEGLLGEEAGTLVNYLVKDPKASRAEVVDRNVPGAKKAILHYEVISISGQRSLLKIKLETGRFHQIRAQLSSRNCPLVGDLKYNEGCVREKESGKLHLCAYRLEFLQPKTSEKMEYEIRPDWLKNGGYRRVN